MNRQDFLSKYDPSGDVLRLHFAKNSVGVVHYINDDTAGLEICYDESDRIVLISLLNASRSVAIPNITDDKSLHIGANLIVNELVIEITDESKGEKEEVDLNTDVYLGVDTKTICCIIIRNPNETVATTLSIEKAKLKALEYEEHKKRNQKDLDLWFSEQYEKMRTE